MAGKRREGRLLAAQFLYQREVGTSSIPLDEALKNLWEQTEAKPEACAFGEKLRPLKIINSYLDSS